MHIVRAYCVEAGKVLDIYQARALFFAQEEPRRRFQFLCSDDACRAANATRVTGVNYDKLVEDERDPVVIKPHFRMNPETPHHDACDWLARERAFEVPEHSDETPERGGGGRHLRHLKSSDLVDIFVPMQTEVSAIPQAPREPLPAEAKDGRRSVALNHGDARGRAGRSNATRADFLETVVSAYELLEPEERREAKLRIGRGSRLPYSKAFCRVEHYFCVRGPRIFHGGVRVQPHGPNFSVRFFDRVITRDQTEPREERELVLYLKRELLLQHWNGRFLIAQLEEAAKRGHYAHCYFFGRVVAHVNLKDRLVVEISTLEHLAFTVRRKVAPALRASRNGVAPRRQ